MLTRTNAKKASKKLVRKRRASNSPEHIVGMHWIVESKMEGVTGPLWGVTGGNKLAEPIKIF